jgi:peptide deformylase
MPSLLKIAQIGHPVLRTRSREVSAEELASKKMQDLIDNLITTMREANGAGLAANQVHEPVRICTIEVSKNPRYPYKPPIPLTVLVNPVLEPLDEETFDNYEGCLSVPNLRGVVPRSTRVRVTALDRHGHPLEQTVQGLSAATFQHECDHLDGVLFVDRVVDPKSYCTWEAFDRFHRRSFLNRVEELVAKYGA